jgi:hypothetical protein
MSLKEHISCQKVIEMTFQEEEKNNSCILFLGQSIIEMIFPEKKYNPIWKFCKVPSPISLCTTA